MFSCLFGGGKKFNLGEKIRFFLPTTMVVAAVRTNFARKNTSIFMLIGSLSRKKKEVVKLTSKDNIEADLRRCRVEFDTQRGLAFFSFCF